MGARLGRSRRDDQAAAGGLVTQRRHDAEFEHGLPVADSLFPVALHGHMPVPGVVPEPPAEAG